MSYSEIKKQIQDNVKRRKEFLTPKGTMEQMCHDGVAFSRNKLKQQVYSFCFQVADYHSSFPEEDVEFNSYEKGMRVRALIRILDRIRSQSDPDFIEIIQQYQVNGDGEGWHSFYPGYLDGDNVYNVRIKVIYNDPLY